VDADLHPDLVPLARLVGTWIGHGEGSYPTIDGFAYLEELTFTHVGKPFLTMVQRTRHPDSGLPMHTEVGYLRVPTPGVVELVVAQPTGLAEVGVGTVADGSLQVRTTVHATPSAKEVTAVERELRWDGDELRYRLAMAAVGHPLTHHLSATLARAT
jgi:hypothetical protein